MQPQNNARTATALVTGATGAVGPALVRRLVSNGYRVRVLARNLPETGLLPGCVEFMEGNITDRRLLDEAVAGMNLIFHMAALLHLNNPPPSLQREYERVNVEGTRRLVEAARKAGSDRMIFFSTINVYGPTPPGLIFDEDAPLRPVDPYAASKVRGEEIVLSGVNAVVLRLAAVYGPRMKGNYRRMAAALHKGLFCPVGSGENRRTLVFDEDAAAAALVAAIHPAAPGRIFNVTDGEVHTLREIIAAICRVLDRRYPLLSLPYPAVLAGSGIIEDLFRFCGIRAPLNRALVNKLVEEAAVSGARLQNQLGYRPEYDLESGWQRTLQGFTADRKGGSGRS
jgi:nucleoside-diphosphate-sugar epimerase